MAKVLLVRSDAAHLSNGAALPFPQGLVPGTFYTSQALRLYTQFPCLDFDLEFMLVPHTPGVAAEIAGIQFYCEFFDDSTMQRDARDPSNYPTSRLLSNEAGTALAAIESAMGWSEETCKEQSRLEYEGLYDTKLRTVRLQTYNPRTVSIKLNAPHLWTHIRYRLLASLTEPHSLYVWGVLGGFSEEFYLENIVLPYGYENRS